MANRDRVPTYRLHKASGQAIVKLAGKTHYLGKWGTTESRQKYSAKIAEYTATDFQQPASDGLTIAELFEAFRQHAVAYYRKNARPTGEVSEFLYAMRPVLSLYAALAAKEFGPLKLIAARALLVNGFTDWNGKRIAAASRGVVNHRVRRLKHIFRWGVEQQLVAGETYHALAAVQPLKRGRTEARETSPVGPVSDDLVERTLPYLPPIVADMVRLQRLTGARPSEICELRPADVDRTGDVWCYGPRSHKTEHHGRPRLIFIGERAQVVLAALLATGFRGLLLFAGRSRTQASRGTAGGPQVAGPALATQPTKAATQEAAGHQVHA